VFLAVSRTRDRAFSILTVKKGYKFNRSKRAVTMSECVLTFLGCWERSSGREEIGDALTVPYAAIPVVDQETGRCLMVHRATRQ